jgi:hypothetical protein
VLAYERERTNDNHLVHDEHLRPLENGTSHTEELLLAAIFDVSRGNAHIAAEDLPSAEVLSAFRYGRIEIPKYVGVDSGWIFLCSTGRGNQVYTTKSFELQIMYFSVSPRKWSSQARTICASSYSSKTSNVERRVPLRIVGSSMDETTSMMLVG